MSGPDLVGDLLPGVGSTSVVRRLLVIIFTDEVTVEVALFAVAEVWPVAETVAVG